MNLSNKILDFQIRGVNGKVRYSPLCLHTPLVFFFTSLDFLRASKVSGGIFDTFFGLFSFSRMPNLRSRIQSIKMLWEFPMEKLLCPIFSKKCIVLKN